MNAKKCLLLIGLLLCSCNSSSNTTSENISSSLPASNTSISNNSGTSSSKPENKLDAVINVSKTITNNFTVKGNDGGTHLLFQRTKDYIYDLYLNGGNMVLFDNNVYSFNYLDNNFKARVGVKGTRSDFNSYYPSFSIADKKSTFEEIDGKFYSTDEEVCKHVSLLANYAKPKEKVAIFLKDNLFNFELIHNETVQVTGQVEDVNSTKIEAVENYIKENKIPEYTKSPNLELKAAFENLDLNYTFDGLMYNSQPIKYKVTEYGSYDYSFSTEDEKGSGIVVLGDDNVYPFNVNVGLAEYDYKPIGTKADFIASMSRPNVDLEYFEQIDKTTYSCDVIDTVKPLAEYFGTRGVSSMRVTLKEDSSMYIAFYGTTSGLDLHGTVSNIGTTKIKFLEDYIATGVLPKLPEYDNKALLDVVDGINDNFTFIGENFIGEAVEFYSTAYGRRSILPSYIDSSRNSNYVVIDGKAFSYSFNEENEVVPSYKKPLELEDYLNKYTFKDINFKNFVPSTTNPNEFKSTNEKIISIFVSILGDIAKNTSEVVLTVDEQGLKITLNGGLTNSMSIEGRISLINETKLDDLKVISEANVQPSAPNYENAELKAFFNNINNNFTVKYCDYDEVKFDEDDYDYWTEDAAYFGYYGTGIVEIKGKVYEFYYNDNKELVYDKPNEAIQSVESFNPINFIDDELLSYFVPQEDGSYYSDYDLNIAIFVNLLDHAEFINQIQAVKLKIEGDKLLVTTIYADNTDFISAYIDDINKTVVKI